MYKMPTLPSRTGLKRLSRVGLVGLALVSATACNTLNGQGNPAEGIGFREARFQEISAMREYRDCRDEALALDEQARISRSAAKYLASARLLEKCEANLGAEARDVATAERMRAYGLSIQNYIKGGDLNAAQGNFEKLTAAFPGKDLYFDDGTSFIETMSALLGHESGHSFGPYSMLNVSADLKSEMRRVNYWKNN